MSEPSDPNPENDSLREQIIGLGERSLRKSYYPQLQRQIDALNEAKAALEEKSESLLKTLNELEAARQRAEESERKFRTLFDGITDGVVAADAETFRFRIVNPAFLQMLGYTEAEVMQLGIPDVHPADELPWLMGDLAKLRRGVSVILRNLRFKRKDGSVVYTDVSATAIDFDGRLCLQGVCRDITERREAEESLRKAKETAEAASHAKDQFIAVLSHELRTPLTPVLTTVTELQEDESLSPELRDELAVVRRNVELEARLIDDLLDVTKITRGKVALHYEVVNAHVCLRTALQICQDDITAKNLTVGLNLDAFQAHVWADPTRLQQVFWNLLNNAVKFTPEGGRITVRTSNDGTTLRIEFLDNGIGIEPEILPRLFNVFEQGQRSRERRFGGLGLGLTIAKAMVEMHHGVITAYSEGRGRGARFTVELPSIPAELQESSPAVLQPELMHPSKAILLVDDHEDTLRTVSKLLRRWGYEVTTANCVRNALETAANGRFDLLVSDLGLPDGSGTEIMQHVREHYGLRGIALSGYGTDEDIRQSRAAGFEEHLVKPMNASTLQSAIQRMTVMGSQQSA